MEEGRFWLLVADAARARIFVGTSPTANLTEAQDFVSPESRIRESDHLSDRPGRSVHGAGQALHISTTQTRKKELVAEKFARALADFLGHAKKGQQFEQLSIVAPPTFLGLLRDQLSIATSRCVLEEVAKDLSTRPVAEIQTHLTRLAL